MVQYNAMLVITGSNKDASRDRIYREFGLESLAERRWSHEIFFFHKITDCQMVFYLNTYISYCSEGVYQTRSANQNNLRQFSTITKNIWVTFFACFIKGWNNFSEELRKIESRVQFKTKFSVSSDPKKTQFLRFMTQTESSYWTNSDHILVI